MTTKLGIIGAGHIAGEHIKAAALAGIKIIGVADVDGNRAKELACAHKIPHAVDDPGELIESAEIDAVVICAPNRYHAPLAVAALNGGKDVLLEKPMAMNVQECEQINAAAKANGRIVQIGFVQRYTAVATTAKRFVDGGRLGRVYHAKAHHYRRRGVPGLGGWFTTKAMSGGGALIDLGPHIIDLSLYLMGSPKPVRVSGKVYADFGCKLKDYLYEWMWAGPAKLDGVCDVEDAAHALVRFEGGATLEINTTWAGNFPDGSVKNLMGVFGEQAGLTFELGGDAVRIAAEDQGHNVDINPKLPNVGLVDAFATQLSTFVDCVQDRTEPSANGITGLTVQSIIDAIYESSRLDREVEL